MRTANVRAGAMQFWCIALMQRRAVTLGFEEPARACTSLGADRHASPCVSVGGCFISMQNRSCNGRTNQHLPLRRISDNIESNFASMPAGQAAYAGGSSPAIPKALQFGSLPSPPAHTLSRCPPRVHHECKMLQLRIAPGLELHQ